MLRRTIPILKKWKVDILLVLLLVSLCAYAWRLLPQTVIRSDGFIHLLDYEQKRFWAQKYWFTGIEVGPSIAGAILPKLFGPHLSWYLWFELGIILFIESLFYLLVRIVTTSRLIAFVASLIVGVHYFGTWNVYGASCYCFYLERVINMPFMLASFLFLHLYLIQKKSFFYVLSLTLYLIGIALGHVELILTPAFALYPFFWHIMVSGKKVIKKGVLIGTAFIIISLGITQAQKITYGNWGPGWTLTEFITHPGKYNYFRAMALQLVYWSDYAPVAHFLTSPYAFGRFSPTIAMNSFPYIFLLYLLIFLLLFAKIRKFRALLATCAVAVAGIFFLNAYVKLPEIIVPNSNRYLYFPTFFLSIFWAIGLWYMFLQHKGVRLLAGIFLLVVYYMVNVALLENIFHRVFEWSRSTEALYSYVLHERKALPPKTLVVATYPEFWVQEAAFFTQTLGRGIVTYETDNTSYYDWTKHIPTYDHVFKIKYDDQCDCVKQTTVK